MPTNQEIASFLHLLSKAVAEGRVILTEKAEEESEDLGLMLPDVYLHLQSLQPADFVEMLSPLRAGYTPLWVFGPYSGLCRLYIKLQWQRNTQLVVISFHPWGSL